MHYPYPRGMCSLVLALRKEPIRTYLAYTIPIFQIGDDRIVGPRSRMASLDEWHVQPRRLSAHLRGRLRNPETSDEPHGGVICVE